MDVPHCSVTLSGSSTRSTPPHPSSPNDDSVHEPRKRTTSSAARTTPVAPPTHNGDDGRSLTRAGLTPSCSAAGAIGRSTSDTEPYTAPHPTAAAPPHSPDTTSPPQRAMGSTRWGVGPPSLTTAESPCVNPHVPTTASSPRAPWAEDDARRGGRPRGVLPTPSQRALIPYPTPRANSLPRLDPHTLPTRSSTGSESRRSPSRHADVCAMLVQAERELAETREESNRRAMALEGATAAAQRARGQCEALRTQHATELAAIREEHAAQTRQLRQQLSLLKSLSEQAMAERADAVLDAARRKDELLSLLDRERAEKSAILADYRTQTESLIGEQGREITTLREALERVRMEYDKLAAQHDAVRAAHGQDAQTLAQEYQSAQERERGEFARRVNELQTRATQEKASLMEQVRTLQETQRRDAARAAAAQQTAQDELQRVTDALRRSQETHQTEMEDAAAETARVQQELHAIRTVAEEQRQTLEQLRQEKDGALTQMTAQKDELSAQHRAKLTQLQTSLDTTARELALERTARKDVEAALEVSQVRIRSLEHTTHTLSTDLARTQEEQRGRERALVQSHTAALDELRTKLRTTATELAKLEQQRRQDSVLEQKLREELNTTRTALTTAETEHQRTLEQVQNELLRVRNAGAERVGALTTTCEELRRQKASVETELHQTRGRLHESDTRLQAVVRQVELLEQTVQEGRESATRHAAQLQHLEHALTEAQEHATTHTQRAQVAQEELEQTRVTLRETQETLQHRTRALQECQSDLARLQKTREAVLAEVAQQYDAELGSARAGLQQTRAELTRLRDELAAQATALREVQETNARLRHDAATREDAWRRELDAHDAEHAQELGRMDGVLDGLRGDLAKAQAMCAQYQDELAAIHRDAEAQCAELEHVYAQSEAARVTLQEDARYREQVNQELQGTVRLLTARLTSLEDDLRRAQGELAEVHRKLQEVHTQMGRREATIGQLNAKLRAYESRDGAL